MNVLDLMLIVLVVYVPNQLHFPTDLGLKGMNVLNILLALTLLAMLVTGARAPAPAPARWRIALLTFFFFVAFFVGQFRAPGDMLAVLTVIKSVLTSMLLYFIFYHSARDPNRIRLHMAVILFVAFVAAVEASREGLVYGLGNFKESHRAAGPFGEDYQSSNRAGAFFVMFLPLFLSAMLWRRTNKRVALAGLLGSGCTAFAIFVTYSRQAYVIAAVATIALALKRNIIVGLLAVGLVAGWTYWAPAAAVQRVDMTYVESESGEEELEDSARSRLIIWEGAAQMIRQHPFGIGLHRFSDEIGTYAELSGKDAHNGFVLIAAEAGIQGFIALLLVLVGLVTLAVGFMRTARGDDAHAFSYGYLVSVGCMMLSNMYGSPFFTSEVMGNFWALSGLVAGYQRHLSQEPTEGSRVRPDPLARPEQPKYRPSDRVLGPRLR